MYTIKDVSDVYNLSQYTIRYYDKEGLLPFVKRDSGGKRVFDENDMQMIGLICCLKETGMAIKDIKTLIDNYQDNMITEARVALINHRDSVVDQIRVLNEGLKTIDDVLIENCTFQ